MYTILGAGLSGLAICDHLSKKGIPYKLFEAKSHGGGHIYSENIDGFTWDEGPHVSFTKYEYVKKYFEENCNQDYLDFPTRPANYFKGTWIMHPAQSNMYALPELLRTECIQDVISIRKELPANYQPANYREWIVYAFGEKFANTFPEIYTSKYWTTDTHNLTTDWIGKRIYFPEINDMITSAFGPLEKKTHYIDTVRYPRQGGFYSFIKQVENNLDINYNKRLQFVSFKKKELVFGDGLRFNYEKLISTLPLPQLIENSDAPETIKLSAKKLKCSQLLIVNIVVEHPSPVGYHWIYIYDKEFYSTRINFTEMLSPENGMTGRSGVQVEVYFSEYRPLTETKDAITAKVISELVKMELIKSLTHVISYHTKWIDWANVIFDVHREKAQNEILNWLAKNGLTRESDDLQPMTDWDNKIPEEQGNIILAGRFAQWKYYWTDDCVMRAKYICDQINSFEK